MGRRPTEKTSADSICKGVTTDDEGDNYYVSMMFSPGAGKPTRHTGYRTPHTCRPMVSAAGGIRPDSALCRSLLEPPGPGVQSNCAGPRWWARYRQENPFLALPGGGKRRECVYRHFQPECALGGAAAVLARHCTASVFGSEHVAAVVESLTWYLDHWPS
jgi:hypothetical protein